MSQQSRNFRFEQSGDFLRMCAKSLPFPLSDIMLHRGHPSRLPFGAPASAALTGPDRDAEPLFLIRGNDRLCFGNVRIPEVSTLQKTGSFYFAATGMFQGLTSDRVWSIKT
jgi:hypothetical protein